MKIKDIALALGLLVCLACAVLGLLQMDAAENAHVPQAQTYQIVISEICAKNDTILADNEGKYRDYVELYNAGADMDLAGFYLTDGKVSSQPFGSIPFAAGSYRVVFLGDTLTGFALAASGGDCIQLCDPSGNIVFQTNTAAMTADQVMSYREGIFETSTDATPGFSNDRAGREAFLKGSEHTAPALVISELLVENASVLPDENGRYSDVAELCNTSDQPLFLGDFWLSDGLQQRLRYRLPDVMLEAGAYLVIYCDGENRIDEKGNIHTNFSLSHGESLCLTDSLGRYVRLELSFPGEDISLARTEEGEYIAASPSLGYPNTEEGTVLFAQSRVDPDAPLVISEVLLSSAGVPYRGTLSDVVEVYNRSKETVDTAGWYLSDGGDPYAYPLPQSRLKPGQCLVVVCSRQNTGFALSQGETVRLLGPNGLFAKSVTCTVMPGLSLSLENDRELSYTNAPVTLGYENTQENAAQFLQEQCPAGLRISEVVTTNDSYLRGAYARTCDWVELYNASNEAISLSEYALSDDSGDPGAYPLPDVTLEAGQYLVLFLTEDTVNLRKGYSVLPFTLSAEGESLYLSKDGQIIDYVAVPELSADTAYGRPGKEAAFAVLEKPTPGQENTKAAQVLEMPVAVTAQGSYDGVEYVDVVLQGEGDIYYTTNSKYPGSSAKLYTGPIRLTETTVIRAVCRQSGKKTSQCLDLTYLINENDTLSAVCVVTDPDNLFDETTGIYMMGPNANPQFPHLGANFWMDWEREATVSLFEAEGGGFSEKCGIKIFGAYSRAYGKKSFACMFRSKYGDSRLSYPLFGEAGLEEYESFVLRACGQDSFMALMRDEVITSLAADHTELAVQKYRPTVVYLNGEYYGLYYIREKTNEHFVAGNYNVDAKDVLITSYNGSEVPEYRALVSYAVNHDLRKQEYYDHLCTLMDVDNYMDYIIAEICIGNSDNSNIKFFKPGDGKWQWLLYDTDMSMGSVTYNSVAIHLNPAGTGAQNSLSTALINALLKRPEFEEAFLRRMAWQMENIWNAENVTARVDYIESLIAQDMVKDRKRWYLSYSSWQKYVQQLRTWSDRRMPYLTGFVQDYFDLTDKQMKEYGFPV